MGGGWRGTKAAHNTLTFAERWNEAFTKVVLPGDDWEGNTVQAAFLQQMFHCVKGTERGLVSPRRDIRVGKQLGEKVLAAQVWRPEFDSPIPMCGMMANL